MTTQATTTATTTIAMAALMIFSLLAVGCKENKAKEQVEIDTPAKVEQQKAATPDIADQGFTDGMTGKVWQNYLLLKMALVNSDADAAASAAGDLAESFGPKRNNLKELALQIAEAGALEKQRQLFSDFGQQAESLFEDGLGEGSIYKHFCPMAFNNQGAYWFSAVAEVRNPYFGDKMLTCGRVEREITR